MKPVILCVVLAVLFLSCSGDHHQEDNPNLLDVDVNFDVDFSLPQFSDLKFPSNSVYVGEYGNAGIIIFNKGVDNYVAYDAADPNHQLEDCSVLEVNGLEAVSQCDDHNTYSLSDGSPKDDGLEYGMREYRVIDNGNNTLTIQNF